MLERVVKLKGHVTLRMNGKLIYDDCNLVVNACLPALANLISGVTSGEFISNVGYGTSNVVPATTDINLNGAPYYYNGIGAASYPAVGSVLFNYGLTAADYGAYGMTIQELGLFANTGAVLLPSTNSTTLAAWAASSNDPIGTNIVDSNSNIQRSVTPPPWSASTVEAVGNLLIDSNGNLQECTTAGTTGTTAPTWSTTIGGTTTDGTAVWTLEAASGYVPKTGATVPVWPTVLGDKIFDNWVQWEMVSYHGLPGPMYAHVTVPAFTFTGSADLTGTWTLTF